MPNRKHHEHYKSLVTHSIFNESMSKSKTPPAEEKKTPIQNIQQVEVINTNGCSDCMGTLISCFTLK